MNDLFGGHYRSRLEIIEQRKAFIYDALISNQEACIIWPFGTSGGYPSFKPKGKQISEQLHRAICQQVYGDPPTEAHEAAHSCGINRCLNWRHLRWATPLENKRDSLFHKIFGRGIVRPNISKATNDLFA